MLLLIVAIGCSIGSFIGAVASRLPRSVNWVNSRSVCDQCGHVLSWKDLVPVFSFILLRGRCRYCGQRLSSQYWIVEIYSGLMFGLAYVYLFRFGWPYFIFSLIIIACLLLLALVDLYEYILPDKILLFMAVVGLIYLFLWGAPAYSTRALMTHDVGSIGVFPHISWRLIAQSLIVVCVLWVFWVATRGRAFGFGDAKYLGVLTLIFGLIGSMVILFMSAISGGLLSILLLVTRKATMKTQLPFGVFLSAGATLYLFLGV